MSNMLAAERAEFVPLQPVRIFFLVFARCVIPALAFGASQNNDFMHRLKNSLVFKANL